MSKSIVIYFLLFIFYVNGCSSNGSIDIQLPPGAHLEDTNAGSFLKTLHINYKGDLSFLGEIRESLKNQAILEDQYLEGKNELIVKRWRVLGNRIKGSFIIYEKMASDGNLWFEYPLGADGIPYSKLIGEKAKNLEPNRKYEGSVYISSKTDKARLILFGNGNYCTSMAILGGA
jgi:hypothetical protein